MCGVNSYQYLRNCPKSGQKHWENDIYACKADDSPPSNRAKSSISLIMHFPYPAVHRTFDCGALMEVSIEMAFAVHFLRIIYYILGEKFL